MQLICNFVILFNEFITLTFLFILLQLYDSTGTHLIVSPPTVNQVYTTVDNTLIIKSLASSANKEQLCCNWSTVAAFKNIFTYIFTLD